MKFDFRFLAVRFFALSYVVKLGNSYGNFLRAANFIYPTVVLAGTLTYFDSPLRWISYLFLAFFVFMGFVYFRLKPLQTEDLEHMDVVQRWTWLVYNEGLNIEPKQFNPIWVVLVNPICILLFLLLLYFFG